MKVFKLSVSRVLKGSWNKTPPSTDEDCHTIERLKLYIVKGGWAESIRCKTTKL